MPGLWCTGLPWIPQFIHWYDRPAGHHFVSVRHPTPSDPGVTLLRAQGIGRTLNEAWENLCLHIDWWHHER
jgi:hypothetical protein